MAKQVTIKLNYPITTVEGKSITEVPINQLTRKELKVAQRNAKDDVDLEDLLISKMTGLTIEDLDLLHISDGGKLQDIFREMSREGRGTAEA